MVRWLESMKDDVAFSDITPEIDMFSVQGPRSAEVMDKLLDAPVDELESVFRLSMPALVGFRPRGQRRLHRRTRL